MTIEKMKLVTTCVTSDPAIMAMLEMVTKHDRPVSYRTFAKHVDCKAVASMLGYGYGKIKKGGNPVRLSTDYAVSFYRSKWNNKPCYHMDWSRIDYIFQ